MSNAENDNLMDQFLDECSEETVCPYCGDPVSIDPHMGCCGEVHETTRLISPCGEYVLRENGDDDLDKAETAKAFEVWIKERAS